MSTTNRTVELSGLEGHERAALFVRHSERVGAEIATEEDGLTDHGRTLALDLGRSISSFGPIKMFSSPVGRCMETARLISQGAGVTDKVIVSRNLGRPGSFVIDEDLVVRRLNLMGLSPFVESWFNEGLPSTEVRSYHSGSKALMDWATRVLSSRPKGLDIHVSHDLDLTPVLVHYLGYDPIQEGLLNFLDGFLLWPKGGKFKISYRGRQEFLS